MDLVAVAVTFTLLRPSDSHAVIRREKQSFDGKKEKTHIQYIIIQYIYKYTSVLSRNTN